MIAKITRLTLNALLKVFNTIIIILFLVFVFLGIFSIIIGIFAFGILSRENKAALKF